MSYADAEMVGKGAHYAALPCGRVPALRQPSSRYCYLDQVMASAWLARRDFVQRVGLEQFLGIQDGGRVVARANGSGRIYGADPYNYVRVADADPPRAANAAQAWDDGLLGHAEVMI
jgi:hypothetical protein